MMEKIYQQIIIGGGASGLMTAAMVGDQENTLLLEANRDVGAKIAISGGGRCNLTNARVTWSDFVPQDHFVESALTGWDPQATVAWFETRGAPLVREKERQYFSVKGAKKIVEVLRRASGRATLRTGCNVHKVSHRDGHFVVETSQGTFEGERVVVATGGLSFPRVGASDIGHKIAHDFGHTIVLPAPALVGMTLQPEQFFFKELSGIATDVEITVEAKRIRNRLLFAHKGITGPAVLDASLYWKRGQITIDFLPGFDWSRVSKSRKQVSTLLPMPRRLARAFLEHLGVGDVPAHTLSPEAFQTLQRLSHYRFAPAGTFGYSKAEVTRGGIDTAQIDPVTMESRLLPGLYFVGEVLDVTGRLGGFNFQWAWSSAVACARAL